MTTSRTPDPYRFGERVERAVAHHAAHTPEAVALQQNSRRVTYRQLRREAAAVATGLRTRGIGPGDFVPVQLERSPEFVATLLGIMETGAAYIAMDTRWPRERVEDVVIRSGARIVVDGALLAEFRAIPAAPVAAPPLSDGTAAACVFFTSGSTGRPKGVISPHRGTLRTLVDCAAVPLDRDSVFLQCAPLPWDGLSLELWAPLVNGGRCVLLDPDRPALDAAALRAAVGQGVNSLWLTSSLFNVLVEEAPELFGGIRLLLTGGERVSPTHARRILDQFPGLHLVNGYGPAESTIFTTVHRIRPEDVAPGASEVPIGCVVPRTGLLLLGPDGRPVPAGQEGEIAVSGDGLALGYLGDPMQTGQRFFTSDGVRYYRTGDLACAGNDGVLRYRGRSDRQFKVNGLRIEPGEIEAVVEDHPDVSSCHVLRSESPPGRIRIGCLYTTVDGRPLDPAVLRAFAGRKLLAGMVPAVLRHVAHLPLGATGKIDSAEAGRLLAQDPATGSRPAPGTPGSVTETAADSAAEPLLREIRELLGRPALTARDDLVAAGLTSLDAIRLSARLGARSGIRLPLLDVYRLGTVDRLWAAVRDAPAAGPESVPVPSAGPGAEGPAPLSHAQERFWLAEQFFPGEVDNLIVRGYVLRGPLDPGALQAALDEVVARHPILRTLYRWAGATAVQRVLDAADAPVPLVAVDLPAHLVGAPAQAVAEHITADWWDTPFDLSGEVPLRARLCRLDAERHLLCLHLHHVAFDGWSEAVLVQDLGAAYAARGTAADRLPADGAGSPPGGAALGYADYSRWERAQADSWTDADLPFWRKALDSCPDPCLPAPAHGGEAARLETVLRVEPHVVQGLARAGAAHGGPLVGALVAAVGSALAHTLGVRDVCLGTLTAGRALPQLEPLVGYFVNPLALPLAGVPDLEPTALLRAAAEAVGSALDHARTPFDRLVHELRPVRDRHPWFQAWAVLHGPAVRGRLGDRVTLGTLRIRPPRTRFELMVEAFPQSDGSWELIVFRRADGLDDLTAVRLVAELTAAFRLLSQNWQK
ncbi:amino acid adenylation domain-containing protein [Streptomyces sp. LN549]|uniref:amino acid adenylation domain-containing protein n=1 Tax=Streptomyces sp. LN549 TaxID=3112979 RepID=UPI0037155FB0